ncbi:hypothetical protein QCA50_009599 [Cerrena zonata]|uniref:Uncharacterized protein n=1 Tax=Cerrena zonata TaxID=2478898 RepID=A0AAW0G048_9APHY
MDPKHTEHLTVSYHGPTSQSTPDDESILEEAQVILMLAIGIEEWRNVVPLKENTLFGIGRNCFEYVPSPPALDTVYENAYPLREWGSDILDTEIFRLEELETFNSTEINIPFFDLETVRSTLLKLKADPDLLTPTASIQEVRKDGSDDPHEPSLQNTAKHRRLDAELGSLLNLIERPRFISIPSRPWEAQSLDFDLKFYNGASPNVVPPNTMEQVWETLEDPFSRCTWIVPIRGTPPWQDCTSAVVLQEDAHPSGQSGELKPDPEMSPTTSSKVVWTRAAVRAFWQFLLELRESGNLGPIALSFHAAATVRAGTKPTAPANNASTANTGSKSQKRGVAPTVLDMDHIKVYHDARCAVHLRNVFHAWAYHCPEKSTSGTGRENPTVSPDGGAPSVDVEQHAVVKSKVRPLRNVKLALLDERCQAILVC